MAIALTIAGSDSGGGAGIQADLKTFSALGVYGATAITALTAQNTRTVTRIEAVSPAMVAAQIEAVFDDMDVRAVKIGMMGLPETVATVADTLERVLARRDGSRSVPLVLDPVMIAKSGARLIDDRAIALMRDRLLPMATVLTPNLPEAAALLERTATDDPAEIVAQGEALRALGPAWVLMKGGHGKGASCIDRLMGPGVGEPGGAPAPNVGGSAVWGGLTGRSGRHDYTAPRVETPNTHGTGCSMSSAIAAGLAQGVSVPVAVQRAHRWLQRAIQSADLLGVGGGHGPVHHFHEWWVR